MIRILVLLAWLIGPPTLSFFVATGVASKFDSELQEAFVKEAETPEDKASAETATYSELCSNPGFKKDFADSCSTNNILKTMKMASVSVSVLALLLIAAIQLAGVLSRKSRASVLALFSPGLYLTVGLTSVIVVVNAALLIGSIWYGESALVGRVHIGIMAALGIGALVGVSSMVKACFSALGRVTSHELGMKLTEKEAPELWKYVKELSGKLKASPPDHIVVGLDTNFYVTEAHVVCPEDTLTGRTLYLSLPLCRIFSKAELAAVIGHELGHFIGEDTSFSLRFYPIYRGASDALVNLEPEAMEAKAEGYGSGAAMFAVLPVKLILGYFLEAFSTAENGISRERELEADRIAAQLGSATNIASALVKIHAFAPCWESVEEQMREKLAQGLSLVNASSLYYDFVGENSTRDSLKELDDVKMAHPTDSHPPLRVRLEALSVTIDSIAAAALLTQPPESAINLIKNHEEIEKKLSKMRQEIMVQNGEVESPQEEEQGIEATGEKGKTDNNKTQGKWWRQ